MTAGVGPLTWRDHRGRGMPRKRSATELQTRCVPLRMEGPPNHLSRPGSRIASAEVSREPRPPLLITAARPLRVCSGSTPKRPLI
eukprot:8625778-Pyramimonas_sp.AAC.1